MKKFNVVNRQTIWVEWYGEVEAESEDRIDRDKIVWEGRDTMRILTNVDPDEDEWEFEEELEKGKQDE